MGDKITIEPGSPPWEPGYDSEIVSVLARLDVPTAGVLRQAGHPYLFWCVEGPNEHTSLWAYTLLEEDEVRELDSITTPSEGFQRVSELLTRGPVTVAMAKDGEGVRMAFTIEAPTGGNVNEVVRDLLESLSRRLDEMATILDRELGAPRAVS